MNKNTQQLQEIFDRVAIHLLVQNKKSMLQSDIGCAYRGVNGTTCAVGCLIDDKHYASSFEGCGVGGTAQGFHIRKAVGLSLKMTMGDKEANLLVKLQNLHDFASASDWGEDLLAIADYFRLDKSAIDFVLAYTNKVTK